MKNVKLVLVTAAVLGLIAAALLRKRRPVRDAPPQSAARDQDELFVSRWTQVLQENAKLYTGLYAGLEQASRQAAGRPERILKEWHVRTVHQWEGESIVRLCEGTLSPAIESGDAETCAKWASLLLRAAHAAGIVKETAAELTLDEDNVLAYIEWDSRKLCISDRVEVLHPAWRQNGTLIEQGHCKLLES